MAKEYLYDFHIHSCLSPCSEEEMTPYNIVQFATVLDLDMIAITDHNTVGNCAAAIQAGEEAGLVVVPGMELSTSEDIHVVCLFPDLENAQAFEYEIRSTLPPIKNKAEVYGRQLLMDAQDHILGEEEILLINATGISIDDVPALCRKYQGVCYPAHIDRSSNSILSVLGIVDPNMDFSHLEITHDKNLDELFQTHPSLVGKPIIRSSDAHSLEHMATTIYRSLPLAEKSVQALFAWFFKNSGV